MRAATTTVTLDVAAATTCSPLPCSEILVQAPYTLDFKTDHGKIIGRERRGHRLHLHRPADQRHGLYPAKLAVDTSGTGTLKVTTTSGSDVRRPRTRRTTRSQSAWMRPTRSR